MLLSLTGDGRYNKNKIDNSTGPPMLLSLQSNGRYGKNR
jgi:hypothetical protein